MAILPVGIGPQEGGYQIERSLRFNSADSAYLSRTPASAGSLTTWTYSTWVKRTTLGAGQRLLFAWQGTSGTIQTHVMFQSNDTILFEVYNDPTDYKLITTQVFRDPSSWYHLVAVYDSTNATSGDRMRLYLNGSRITAFGTAAYPSQNYQGLVNSTNAHNIGRRGDTGVEYFTGYMAETFLIDGSALDPTSFGEYNSETGVWQPKAYTGSYGTNGFYLDFADNSSTTALGYDAAGSNDWTPNNFSVTAGAGNDSLVDTPTPYGTDTGVGAEVRGNYATLNPISTNGFSFTNGNLDCSVTGGTAKVAIGTVGVSSGKWYWEVVGTSGVNLMIGVSDASAAITSSSWTTANGWAYYLNGEKFNNNSGSAYGASYTTSDVIGVALDMDAGTLTFYKNGSSQGTAFSTGFSGKTIVPMIGNGSSSNSQAYTANFGQRPFAYAAPTGFKALCTQNLPEPTVVDGGEYFNPVLYTGNNSNGKAVTGVGFSPDFIWFKSRSAANGHCLVNRLTGVNKGLGSDSTAAEQNPNLASFDADGFTVNSVGDFSSTNANGNSIVAWNWKAGGTGVSNTAGSITSTVSANTTAGFSIATYTGNGTNGATIGHGLGAAPSMIIVKSRGTTDSWGVYHTSIGNTKGLYLETTSAAVTSSAFWNNTSPTSTVFSVSNNSINNASSTNYVAYVFAPVAGYSAFGSYTGNGSSDGPFVYTGFKPKFLLVKKSDGAENWIMLDGERNTYNVVDKQLLPNTSDAEGTITRCDFLSNGFKVRAASTAFNSGTMIYAAFAEVPMKFALGR